MARPDLLPRSFAGREAPIVVTRGYRGETIAYRHHDLPHPIIVYAKTKKGLIFEELRRASPKNPRLVVTYLRELHDDERERALESLARFGYADDDRGPAWMREAIRNRRVTIGRDARRGLKARRDVPRYLLSEAELHRQSADSLERLYNDGRATKGDITRWVRSSAKHSGRVYEPTYRSGAYHDRLWLRRREDVEDKLFAKRAGFWRGRR